MIFQRIEARGLAHYSYLVGCAETGQVAVIDPRRDVDVYERTAAENGWTIGQVLETHIHADFASGGRELARRTGAPLHASRHDEGELYEVSFPHEDLGDGDEIEIGSVRLRALHTPGHTPEHLSHLVFTPEGGAEPHMMLSGDFLFVGSLGRPDLLGEEAKRALADAMYDSVRDKLAGLPDALEIHPGHGAGSMCGAGMSDRPFSTLGIERVSNPYLDPGLEREAFVDRLLGHVPPFPPYYLRMKRINSDGPALLGELPGNRPIAVDEFAALMGEGAVVVDSRPAASFGEGHVPGALGIGLGPSLSVWGSWLIPYDKPILVVLADPTGAPDAARALVRVGLDDIRGYLDGGMTAWSAAGQTVSELPQLEAPALELRRTEGEPITIVDVRTAEEYADGHVDGALNIMGGFLADELERLPRDGSPIAVMCAGGYRSTAAASVLLAEGFDNVFNVPGGVARWAQSGLRLV